MTPRWAEIAFREMLAGIEEIAGGGHSLRVLDYHQTTSLKASDDETAWCAAFVGWCLRQALILGSQKANARSYLLWGEEIEKPRPGAITVLWRGQPSGWQGHVGFYVGELEHSVLLLGGNQGNRVSIAPYPKSRVLGHRWPLALDRFT